jgi:hypothetical protein
LYGSPTGCAVRTHQLKPYRRELRDFVALHADHRGLQAGLRVIRDWLQSIENGERSAPGYRDAAGLVRHGVESRDVLIEAAACFMYTEDHAAQFKRDIEIVKAIGHAVLRLAPRTKRKRDSMSGGSWRPFGGQTRTEVGRFILDHLAGLLVNIKRGIEAAKQLKVQDKRDMLHLPFPVEKTERKDADTEPHE